MERIQKLVEQHVAYLIIMTFVVILIAGLIEIIPLMFQRSTTEPTTGVKPYTALQLVGRDIYIREGCSYCHSQMIRPFRAETERYGHYSVAGESVYDHPFLWGSKRTGPDLARVGGRYSDDWQMRHLTDPRAVVPGSIMPAYPSLNVTSVEGADVQARMKALRIVGLPYTDQEIADAPKELVGKTEMDALVAYLQSLGLALKNTR